MYLVLKKYGTIEEERMVPGYKVRKNYDKTKSYINSYN